MDYTEGTENYDREEGDLVFIADSGSSESEEEMKFSHLKHHSSCEQTARLSRENSPPLLLAFKMTSGPGREEEEEEEEDSDHSIEEWMMLGGEEEVGDSSIQLNLSYWSENDPGDEDQNVKAMTDIWAISEKDKYCADLSLPCRYFVPGRSLSCNICNRTGHLAKTCYYQKKCPTCVLCGIRGHIQRDCPGRPCSSCGLPSHGFRPCERPPLWNQHCQRCGVTGHLSDACPDTWRQYHLTIQVEVPLRPQTPSTLKHKRFSAHCYNCSEKGHYGYECTKRKMGSGTSPCLPYVCHYDTLEDIIKHHTRMEKRAKELVGPGSLPLSDQQHLSEATGDSGEENQPVQARSRTKQEACGRAGRRKTWPERRRERREVKRLRREAQARREGGLLGRPRGKFDDEFCPLDPFMSPLHSNKQSTPPPQKKKKKKRREVEAGVRRSRKSRGAERWKKRGGIKRGDLHPHGDLDKGSENLLSPKQRVRHRRR